MTAQHFDVLIIGAGISGIGLACHLRRDCPNKRFAILERRQAIGGTWDLFRYPGIRSDSDMSTFGFNFRPWTQSKVLADGPAIRQYVQETADEYGVTQHIHFGRQVLHASWSSSQKRWTITVTNEATNQQEQWTCDFLLGCTGYYNYDQGFQPYFKGQENFKGQIIHPQHWPENLDYSGKRVVIIGSGATAITLVPAMTDKAAHVTMLQRSPTYIATVPSVDFVYDNMKKVLPESVAYRLTRARNINLQKLIFSLSKQQPKLVKRLLLAGVRHQLRDTVDMKHFTPSYNPWDQRLCVVPDGDLFKVLRKGKASIVTDHIDHLTETGILLKSGEHIDADIVVSATGLNVQLMGSSTVDIDGKALEISKHLTYNSIMVEGVPNAAIIFGYTNASWTLKVDIAADYICRLLNHMDKKGYSMVVAKDTEGCATEDTVLGGLSSGYIMRAVNSLPKQGKKAPWKVLNDYSADRVNLPKAGFNDEFLHFEGKKAKKKKLFGLIG
ncbi:MAG: NAD(P)/FAD-dependent oxidoreductase [Pseudomonadota bacterium]|nr:NAD(P)/FAD-dependent oxidoreductase [Pseudomonadota bacterium]